MYTCWEIRGVVQNIVQESSANDHIDYLSHRYSGKPYGRTEDVTWEQAGFTSREIWEIDVIKLIPMVSRAQTKSEPERNFKKGLSSNSFAWASTRFFFINSSASKVKFPPLDSRCPVFLNILSGTFFNNLLNTSSETLKYFARVNSTFIDSGITLHAKTYKEPNIDQSRSLGLLDFSYTEKSYSKNESNGE